MIVTLKLSSEEVAVLTAVAGGEGVDVESVLHNLISTQMRGAPDHVSNEDHLAQQHEIATIMAAWKAEDNTDDSEELAEREREISEFVTNMNRWRAEGRPPLTDDI